MRVCAPSPPAPLQYEDSFELRDTFVPPRRDGHPHRPGVGNSHADHTLRNSPPRPHPAYALRALCCVVAFQCCCCECCLLIHALLCCTAVPRNAVWTRGSTLCSACWTRRWRCGALSQRLMLQRAAVSQTAAPSLAGALSCLFFDETLASMMSCEYRSLVSGFAASNAFTLNGPLAPTVRLHTQPRRDEGNHQASAASLAPSTAAPRVHFLRRVAVQCA